MPRDHRICRYRGKFAVSYIDDNGQRQRRSTGTTDRRQAEAFLSELLKHERSTRPAPTTTIGEIWEGYRLTLGSRPAATTMVHEWKALKGRFGSVRASDLLAVDNETNRTTAETLSAEHTAARREQGRKDGAILTELSRLRTACNWAVERGKLEQAPVWIMPPKPRARARHLSREQFATFLDACHMPHLRLFAVLAIGTGGRMGAILDLTWDRIDFGAGLVHLDDPERDRTAKGRAVVPMTGSARAALQDARQGALTRYVIEWAGDRVRSVKKGVRATGARAGLGPVSPHDFRHSAAVWMAEDGVSMPEIARYLGHEDSRITERTYARFSPTYLRNAAASLEVGPFARKA